MNRVIFSQDQDFLRIAREWQSSGRDFAGVVFAHQMGVTIGDAVRDLELIVNVLTEDEMRNRLQYLPL